jgi:hypothetical protein
MRIESSDIAAVKDAVVKAIPGELKEWPGGWPHEIEAALMDAVLSIRANYGQSHNGVRGAIARYRGTRGGVPLDDLDVLAHRDAESLAATLGVQQRLSGGKLKASAITEAASNLRDVGVRHAADLATPSAEHKAAYVGVHGLGPVTWSYFLMLLGLPGIKADTWIVRFVKAALDRSVTPGEARALLHGAADDLGVSPSRLDHNVWLYMRGQHQDRRVVEEE